VGVLRISLAAQPKRTTFFTLSEQRLREHVHAAYRLEKRGLIFELVVAVKMHAEIRLQQREQLVRGVHGTRRWRRRATSETAARGPLVGERVGIEVALAAEKFEHALLVLGGEFLVELVGVDSLREELGNVAPGIGLGLALAETFPDERAGSRPRCSKERFR